MRRGGLIAFPTETVYGIAANALDDKAVGRLYEVKARPAGKPFTVHISGIGAIAGMGCEVTADTKKLMDKFWPGPLTLILKSGKNKKIGFRMPANAVAMDLILEAGVPIVAPSANLSGNSPATNAAGVLKDLDGKIDAVLDGGETRVGIESTVIDMTEAPPKVLREGAIGKEVIRVLG